MTTTFRMTESGSGKYGVPKGIYRGKFLGTQLREADPNRLGDDGKPFGDGLEWEFECVGDVGGHPCPFDGKIMTITTATNPTSKNSCGRILTGVLGRTPAMNEDVDIAPYVGRVYQVCVDKNRSGNERVSQVYSLGLSGDPANLQPAVPGVRQPAPAAPPANAQRAPVTAPPPRSPRPAQAAPPATAQPEPGYWVQVGDAEPVLMAKADAQAAVNVASEPVLMMPEDQSGGWKDAAELGFKQHVPF